MNQPHLRDRGLRLSPFRPTEAGVLYRADQDPEHRRRFEFPADFVASLQHAAVVIARWEQERIVGTRLSFAVRSAETGEVFGGCELHPVDHDTAALSYWTLPGKRGRGIASRAVGLVSELARSELGVLQLEAEVDADNVASRRVAERNGLEQVGYRGARILLRRDLVPAGAAQPELGV